MAKIKRFTAILLSTMMIFINVFSGSIFAYAETEIAEEPVIEQVIDEDQAEEIQEEVPEEKEDEKSEEVITEEEVIEEDVDVEAEQLESDEVVEPVIEVVEEETKEEVKKVAFEQSKVVDGVKITVSADAGVFPEGASLRVQKLSAREEAAVEKAIDKVADDAEVAVQYNFDIAVVDEDGNEIEPKGEAKVSFETEEIADEALKAEVFHIKDNGVAEALDVEADNEVAEVAVDGFSPYSLRFTYYNEATGHNDEIDLAIGDSVTVQTIANALGYSSKTVASAQTDASSVVSVWEGLNDVWYVEALSGDTTGTHGLEIYFTDGTKVNVTIRTHVHSWNFTVSGNQATLRCAAEHCVHTGTYTKTITASNAVYDGNGHGASLSGDIGGSDVTIGDIYYASGTNVTTGGSTSAPVNAGTYTAYVEIRPHGGTAQKIYTTFTIDKATIDITSAPAPKTGLIYNGEPQELHTAGSAKSHTTSETFTIQFRGDSYDTSHRYATNAGTYKVWYKVFGDQNHYDTAETEISCTIGQRPVYITGIYANDRVYNSTTNVVMVSSGASITNVVSGEHLSVTAAGHFNNKNVGTDKPVAYSTTLVAGQNTLASNYYVASTNDVYADVAKKHLLIDWENATELQYNGQAQAPTAIIRPGNASSDNDGKVYQGDVVRVDLTNESRRTAVGGPYEAHVTDLSGTDAGNYYLDDRFSNVGAKFSIVPRVVDVQWADLSQEYDAIVLAPTVSLNDSVAAAEGVSVTLIQPTNAKNAGTYTATAQLTGTNKSNFVINPFTISEQFTITKAPLVVKANGWLYYGELIGEIKDAHYEIVSGLKGTDTEAVLVNTGRFETDYGKKYNREGFASDPVTDDEHSYYLLPVFENAANYEIINTDGELTVYPKPVTLAWTHTHAGETEDISEEKTYVYDGKKHIYEAEVTEASYVHVNGVIVEEKIEVTLEDNIERDACVKKNHEKYIAKAMKLSNKNYSLFYKDGTPVETKSISYKIDQRPIELSWAPSEFTYNGKVQKPVETIENLQTNDEGEMDAVFAISHEVEETTEVIDPEREDKSIEVGEYTITAVNEQNGYLLDKNYTLDNGTGLSFDYMINPRALEFKWTPNATEFVYNAQVQGQSAEVTNFAENEDADDIGADSELVEIIKFGDWEAIDAGNYVASIEAIAKDGRAANYSFEGIDRKWVIKQAPLTVIAKAKTITYGDNPANAGVSYSGFKGKDDASVLSGSVKYSYNYAKWGKPGTYKIDISKSNLSAKNYKISYKAGNLKVNDKVNRIAAKAIAKGKDQASISWNKVSGAASYEVYFSLCNTKGKEHQPKKIATVKGTSYVVKKLKKNTFYKFYVIAKDSNGKQISKSLMGHFITGNVKGKETNAKSLKVNASKVSVKVGKTYKVKGTVTAVKKGKSLHSHCETLRFFSSNSAVATVDAKGNIKGVAKGWCRIYVQTANGIWQSVEVTVA